ncbi:hypothetical protein D3C76_1883370 [compost metagenome]
MLHIGNAATLVQVVKVINQNLDFYPIPTIFYHSNDFLGTGTRLSGFSCLSHEECEPA